MGAINDFLDGFLFGASNVADETTPAIDPNATPTPTPTPTPAPVAVPVVGDLISAVVADRAAVAGDTDALNAATLKLSTDQARLKADSDALASEINTNGGVGSVDPASGVITAYEPDGSGGVKVSTLRPVTAPVAPAPSPAS